MHVFVAGGAGYVGSKLVPSLLGKGHVVTVYDLCIDSQEDFFQNLQHIPNLHFIKGDIRDLRSVKPALRGCDAVIHLAYISDRKRREEDPDFAKSVNVDSFEPFIKLCKIEKIRRFIYASSLSVYGTQTENDINESMEIHPITDHAKHKVECEKALFRHKNDHFICTILRPATICGYAPQQRLDSVINVLTHHAYHLGKVKVTGGMQMRPSLHIKDMVRAYLVALESMEKKIQGEIFNIGYHNHTILGLAQRVKQMVSKKRNVDLLIEDSKDSRSYHISSKKIKDILGFTAQYSFEEAVEDLVKAFEEGKIQAKEKE